MEHPRVFGGIWRRRHHHNGQPIRIPVFNGDRLGRETRDSSLYVQTGRQRSAIGLILSVYFFGFDPRGLSSGRARAYYRVFRIAPGAGSRRHLFIHPPSGRLNMLFEGKSITCTMLEGGIVEFQFNLQNESVNKFNRDTLAEFNEATATLAKNKDVKGVVVTSGKDVFIVGADITEFLSLFAAGRDKLIEWTKQANAIFNGFEDLPVPTICAINGIALGGGFFQSEEPDGHW